ncbi:MAG: pyruvate kinase [Anaerolineae bacterium]
MKTAPDYSNPLLLLEALRQLRQEIYEEGQHIFARWNESIQRRKFTISALNLAYYLALRKRDLRALQTALTPWGLSSLGRIEGRVMPNLDAVIATLSAVCGETAKRPRQSLFARGQRILRRQTNEVFGPPPTNRRVRIMVTMPTEAAEDYDLIRDLLLCGMDCIRINCAHDTPEAWLAMITHLRRAETETGRRCKVAMDLGGPKIRTQNVIAPKGMRLHIGDQFRLTRDKPESVKAYPFQAQCSLPQIFDQIKRGAGVWIDDGKLGAQVKSLKKDAMVLVVTHAGIDGEKLRPDKGINFPDTDLRLPALTEQDVIDLDFIAQHADIVHYSFVQDAADMRSLQKELAKRMEHSEKMAIVAKVETKRAIKHLPEIIVQTGGKQPLAVMIARGDLAVEIGYQRLAEMQEQILWLCEAAHVPVIWATQVLENLVKKGRPSRAEMTDAAMSERSECVMLNKGPYIREAVTALDDVLRRMEAHQSKKTARLRALKSWGES